MNDKADETDQRTARQSWKGFDDAFARGIELVATPLLFGLGGWYLDRWAGTRPLFTLLLFLVAVVGMAARMYYAYAAAMDEHERAAPWARRQASAAGSGNRASAAGSGNRASAAESGNRASAAGSGDRASAAERGGGGGRA